MRRLPETPIVVDYFTTAVVDEYRSSCALALTCPLIFFLSHVHADHTVGLTPSWNAGKLYTTKVSAALLTAKFNIDRALIHTLDYYQPAHIVLTYPNARCTLAPTTVTVTAVPAHHCPGAAVFCFRGFFGTAIYTGDCRWHAQADIARSLSVFDEHRPVDALYVDNTFAEADFTHFHNRTQCVDAIESIIRTHDDCDIIINSDSVGKEDVLVALSHRIQTLIAVDADKFRLLTALHNAQYSLAQDSNETADDGCLHWPNWYRCFTTDPAQTFIRCLPKRHVSKQTIVNMNKSLGAGERRVVGVIMSGWALRLIRESKQAERVSDMTSALIQRPRLVRSLSHINERTSQVDNIIVEHDDPISDEDGNVTHSSPTATRAYCCCAPSQCVVHFVPFSSHSSHTELTALIKLIRPRTLYAVTRNPLPMNLFRQWIDHTKPTPISIPSQLTSPSLSAHQTHEHTAMSARRRDHAFISLKRRCAPLSIAHRDDDDESEHMGDVEIGDARSRIRKSHAVPMRRMFSLHTHIPTAAQRRPTRRTVVVWSGAFTSPPSTPHSYRCDNANCKRAIQHRSTSLTFDQFVQWQMPNQLPPPSLSNPHSSSRSVRKYPPLPLMSAQSAMCAQESDRMCVE